MCMILLCPLSLFHFKERNLWQWLSKWLKMESLPNWSNIFDCLWCKITTANSVFYDTTIYQPPDHTYKPDDLVKLLSDSCDQLLLAMPNTKIIIDPYYKSPELQKFLRLLEFPCELTLNGFQVSSKMKKGILGSRWPTILVLERICTWISTNDHPNHQFITKIWYVPMAWKRANLVPVLKELSADNCNQLRPKTRQQWM